MISWSTQPWRNDKSVQIFDVLDLSGRPIPRLSLNGTNICQQGCKSDNPSIPEFCMLTCNSLILGVDNVQN